jgi:hypothetical protein
LRLAAISGKNDSASSMRVLTRLRDAGTAVLLVEQVIDKALAAEPDLPYRLEQAYFGQQADRSLVAASSAT